MSEGDTNINKPKRKLVIKEGSEFKIKVEGLEEFNDSFFKDIYDSAVVNAVEIVNNTKKYYSAEEKFKKDKEEANNIIAFVGERGTGKSSAMVSFAEALKDINDKGTDLDKPGFEKFKKLKDVSFVNLDIIDPALLEDKESIFEIIIAKMFSKFKEQMEKQSDTLEYDDKKRLLKKFQNVYMDLKTINTDRKDMFKESPYGEDIIETLVSLASGSNMRKSFIELVNEFLKMFAGKENGNNRFLVIPIDDLDMNIKHSAEMAEQIRKYLMVPNVIVLMAIKMGQLKDSIEQMYRKNYAIMLKEGNLSDDPKEMAERYIEKLIPNGRKLYLPDIRAHKNGIEEDIELIFENSIYKSKGDSIEDTVLKMTYEKTGLIFIKNDYDVHYLVPDNLRELQNYLIMLNKLDNIKLVPDDGEDYEEDEQIRLHNLEKFETYFLKNWVRRNLQKEYVELIKSFYSIPIKKKNKFIIMKINKILHEQLQKEFKENFNNIIETSQFKNKVDENYIFDIDNNSINISIGDVLEAMNIYNDYDSEEVKKLKFCIKTIYSIALYKLLFCKKNYNDAMTLIGGNILGQAESKLVSLDIKNYQEIIICNKKNNDLVNEIVDEILRKIETNDKSEDTSLMVRIMVVEFINLFIYIYPSIMGDNYRTYNKPYYKIISNLGRGRISYKNARFNILGAVIFLLNPMQNLKKIFQGRVELVLENKELNNDKSKEEMMNMIQKCSWLSDYTANWRKKYKMILPIYSMEILECMMIKLPQIIENKFKKSQEDYYNNRFKRIFTAVLPEFINYIKENNKFLISYDKNKDGICLIEEAYNKCAIVKIANGNMNNEYMIMDYIEAAINDIYEKSR